MKDDKNVSDEALEAMMVVADNITQARKARNLTQENVAKACNIGLGTYAALEKGSLSPGIRAYVKVIDYFGMTASLMFMCAPQIDTTGRRLRLGTTFTASSSK